ncbi:MAG TPA: hypothetical protein VI297_01025 [Gemmatimonadales bacterium]
MPQATGRDWLLPGLIVALGLALRLRQFNYFLVPDTDFFDLRAVGVALVHRNPPPLYLRPPLYSLLMAGLAPLFRGPDPVLLAAESVNLAAFAVAAFSLHRLAVRFVGSAAWVVTFLFAMDGLAFHMALQPRAELPTVALVILGCYLATVRPTAAYVSAALASVTRYEGAFLIPALFVRDLVRGPHRGRAVVLAALASAGLVVWLGLNFRATGHVNPYYEYAGAGTTAAGGAFLWVLARTCLGAVGLAPEGKVLAGATVLLAALIVGGLVSLLRTSRRDALPIVTFFALTLVLNLAFFSPTPEHAFMIVWVTQLAVVAGFVGLGHVARSLFPFPSGSAASTQAIRLVLGIGTLLALALFAWSAHRRGTTLPAEALAVTAVAIGAILATARPSSWATALLLAAVIVAVPVAVRRDLRAIHARLDTVTHVKGELRRAGEWFAAHAAPDEQMVVVEPWVVAAFAAPRSMEDLVDTRTLTSRTPDELATELRRLGVDYVIWNSQHGNLPPTDFYFRKYRVDLLSQLAEGRSSPDFELLDTLRAGPSYAYVYRVRP